MFKNSISDMYAGGHLDENYEVSSSCRTHTSAATVSWLLLLVATAAASAVQFRLNAVAGSAGAAMRVLWWWRAPPLICLLAVSFSVCLCAALGAIIAASMYTRRTRMAVVNQCEMMVRFLYCRDWFQFPMSYTADMNDKEKHIRTAKEAHTPNDFGEHIDTFVIFRFSLSWQYDTHYVI